MKEQSPFEDKTEELESSYLMWCTEWCLIELMKRLENGMVEGSLPALSNLSLALHHVMEARSPVNYKLLSPVKQSR